MTFILLRCSLKYIATNNILESNVSIIKRMYINYNINIKMTSSLVQFDKLQINLVNIINVVDNHVFSIDFKRNTAKVYIF